MLDALKRQQSEIEIKEEDSKQQLNENIEVAESDAIIAVESKEIVVKESTDAKPEGDLSKADDGT